MQKLDPNTDGKTMDIVADNIAKLKELFPEIVTEGKVDFEALKEVLGDFAEDREERYSFNWNGKSKARMLAQTPSNGTLRPCPEESVNSESTQNLFIEGDNLEVLKLLQKGYYGKIKMVYIDPPYNTGKDLVYRDVFGDNVKNYKMISGQIDEEGRSISTNTEANGRYHTNWLNMIFPRLKLARNLLKDDGVVAISIDEKEVHNLKKVCDEVFGEENYSGEIVWKNSSKNDQDYISIQHEYFLVYVKDKNVNKGSWVEKKDGLDEIYAAFDSFHEQHGNNWEAIHKEALSWYRQFPESNPIKSSKHYNRMDEKGVYFASDISGPNHGQYVYDVIHPITGKICKAPASGWRYPEETMIQRIKGGLVHFGPDHNTIPNNKTYLKDTEYQSVTSIRYKDGRVASKQLIQLFGQNIFTNPKDSDMLCDLLKSFEVANNDLVLDFFAGSATTAESVMKLNLRFGNSCRYILIQFPEDLNETLKTATGSTKATIARAIKYLKSKGRPANVCEIGKARISLVSKTLKEENPNIKTDYGFKVLKLDSTNIKPWDADFDNYESSLDDYISNIKPGRSEEDVLYEILLKYGLDLTLPIEERIIADKKVFIVGLGALVLCLADGITLDVVEGIADLKEELKPEVMRVVFKDNGFSGPDGDVVKTNAIQILRQHDIMDVKSL